MRVIKPVSFNATTHLSSSTAAEVYPTWNSTTTYAEDAYVVDTSGLGIYQSLIPNNQNNLLTNIQAWVYVGPSNKYAMFDNTVSTATTASNSLTVVLRPGAFNSLALLSLVGTQIQVSLKNTYEPGGVVVYTKTIDLVSYSTFNWYDYFFAPYETIEELILTNLPQYPNSELTITLTSGGVLEIGTLVWGTVYDLGATQYGLGLGIIDYSKKETDDFGVTTFVERDFSKRISARFLLPNIEINRTQKILSTLRATPSIWIPSTDPKLSSLTVYGFYRDFNIEIPYPEYSYCSLEIEGLT
jgi:hypothetical protein